MSALGADTARSLAEREFEHPLISAALDLDPANFATAEARTSEITSLVDTARRQLHNLELDHEDRVALEADLDQIETYLREDLDASGAQAVAVYSSRRAGLFETIQLSGPLSTQVRIGLLPEIEWLLPPAGPATACLALVDRRDSRIFSHGRDGDLDRRAGIHDQVHGQHHKGGWAEANYERSIEADVDAHLRRTAEELHRLWLEQPYARLVLGGQHGTLAHLRTMLHGDLQPLVASEELSIDLSAATASSIDESIASLSRQWRREAQKTAVARLTESLDGRPGSGAAVGLAATLVALNQSQVKTLVLGVRIDAPGGGCSTCGQLYASAGDVCATDGTQLQPLASLRGAMIRETLRRGGNVLVLDDLGQPPESGIQDQNLPEVEAFGGIGALLRWNLAGGGTDQAHAV